MHGFNKLHLDKSFITPPTVSKTCVKRRNSLRDKEIGRVQNTRGKYSGNCMKGASTANGFRSLLSGWRAGKNGKYF
jgi:hypothetical protein